MAMKAVKLSPKAIEIALRSGKTVNQGILKMGEGNHRVTPAVERFVNTPIPDEKYWKKLKETVIEAIHEVQR